MVKPHDPGRIIQLDERRLLRRQIRMTRVLVVEDDMLLGLDLTLQLEDWGFDVDGPHPTSSRALKAIKNQPPI